MAITCYFKHFVKICNGNIYIHIIKDIYIYNISFSKAKRNKAQISYDQVDQ